MKMVEPRLFYEKVWGGVAIEDGGLDDEEAAEDLDGDYGNEREGRRAGLQTGRFGDGEWMPSLGTTARYRREGAG